MTTTTFSTEKKEQTNISWGMPSEIETSIEDLRTMITEAERDPGYSFDEYTNKVTQWLHNKL